MLTKEIKKCIFTFAYILFVSVMLFTYLTQVLPELEMQIRRPSLGADDYGGREVEIPEILMPAATESLVREYLQGFYVAYPFMFIKEVHLKADDTERIASIINQLTGLTKEELDSFAGFEVNERPELPEYQLNENISYEDFRDLMRQADDIIGGGSKYSDKNIISNFSIVPMSYEDALEEYERIVTGKNLGLAYTRLFCDFMGIFLAIITVFTAASFWNMDSRAKLSDLIYSRNVGSCKLVITRILAVTITMLPVIVLPYLHMVIKVSAMYSGISISWLPAFGEMLLWLIPETVFIVVFAAFITEISSPFLAIFVQGVWWFISINGNDLVGSINKWTLILRHNSLGDIYVWEKEVGNFIWNRIYYSCLSIVLIFVIILIFDMKRKGKIRYESKIMVSSDKKKSFNKL